VLLQPELVAPVLVALAANVQVGGLGKLVNFIEGIFDDVLVTLEEVAKNLPAALAKADFSGFENGIRAVYDAFGVLFKNIDLRTVDAPDLGQWNRFHLNLSKYFKAEPGAR
jgi:hypothetical protein